MGLVRPKITCDAGTTYSEIMAALHDAYIDALDGGAPAPKARDNVERRFHIKRLRDGTAIVDEIDPD